MRSWDILRLAYSSLFLKHSHVLVDTLKVDRLVGALGATINVTFTVYVDGGS